MDLIYATKNGIDVGVLSDYTFDLAFGKDENNFTCSVPIADNCCEAGYILYIESTEYGGVIDKVKVDSEDRTITYSGRTWHGILAGKVLEPNKGEDYLLLSGEANSVLSYVIARVGLSDVFCVRDDDSGIDIPGYSVRYSDVYSVFEKMLASATAKLHITYKRNMVELSAVPYIDYSQDEEWDSSQFNFVIEKNHRPTNHLVCLGSGELKSRNVIHLFTDANGGVQKYTRSAVPVQDSDYILDKSKQVLFGSEEVTEVYDFSGAQSVENYIRLIRLPGDWENTFSRYFREEDGEFINLELETRDVYLIQDAQPDDWDSGYKNYFTKSGSTYVHVTDASEKVYTLQTSEPIDWEYNYKSYFAKNGSTYVPVTDVCEKVYTLQDYEPIDWENGYKNYFLKSGSAYAHVTEVVVSGYELLESKPVDWNMAYENYYTLSASGSYVQMNSITVPIYEELTQQPSDWKTNYRKYYERYKYSNEYVHVRDYKPMSPGYVVRPEDDENYILLEDMPSDWFENYENYYIFDWKMHRFENIQADIAPYFEPRVYYANRLGPDGCPVWLPRRYYTLTQRRIVPSFQQNTYYVFYSRNVRPDWEANKYYTYSINSIPQWSQNKYYTLSISYIPKWVSGKYFTKTQADFPPDWVSGKYFEKVIDHYAVLVEGGIEKLKASYDCDKIEISFDPNQEYDIGDIVGATDAVTGLSVYQPISKKIVKIKDGKEEIDYEIGE